MNILFIPHPDGGSSHLIPLIKLYAFLDKTVKSAFFLSAKHKRVGEFYRTLFGINILEEDNQGTISSELTAYLKFKPDIVVDDTNLTTAYVRQIKSVKRVTIIRTGVFPNIKQKNEHHTHSMDHTVDQMPRVEPYGFIPYKKFPDFFNADFKIIPGIKSIEVIDETLASDTNCIFSGPLILKDFDVFKSQDLINFININNNRKKVYLTYGSTQWYESPAEIVEFIDYLLSRNVAVITNVTRESKIFIEKYPNTFHYQGFLPMHYVCSNVDCIFHQCGSATYHYPILHNLFGVTLGTQRYDRDDVATQLEALGVSKHVPSPEENPHFLKSLKEYCETFILACEKNEFAQSKITNLQLEIRNTIQNFNFMKIINQWR